jgi:membrane protein
LRRRLYVANFTDYNATYGSVGGVMVVLLWMYVSSIAILAAAELNAEIEHASPYGKAPGQKTQEGRRVLGAKAGATGPMQQPPPAARCPARGRRHRPSPGMDRRLAPIAAAVILGVRAWNDARAKAPAPALPASGRARRA